MSERLALDCSLYRSPDYIPLDLAALFVEAMDTKALEERIWPYRFELRNNNRVICPEMGDQDVSDYFSLETDQDRQETEAALKIRQALVDEKEATAVVWLSPPNENYPEGRITIGKIAWENNVKTMECYGLPVNFSKEIFIQISQKISPGNEYSLKNLRSQVYIFSSEVYLDPWQEIKKKLPLGQVWSAIEKKQAELRKEEILRDTRLVADSVSAHLWSSHPIKLGAYLECEMERMGYRINAVKSGCGGLNKDLFSLSPMRVLNSPHGMVSTEKNKGVYVKECPYCGRKINKIIHPGYTCQCGHTYKGVC